MSRIWVVGSVNMDFIVPTDRFPSAGETISGGDLQSCPGGKGANQACAAARLGGETILVAQVGDDLIAPRLVESLHQANVKTDRVGVAKRSTGCALICVRSDGENAIVISPGANATLTPSLALDRLDHLQAHDIVLLQLEIPLETVEAVAIRSRQRGATVILDPAPARALPRSLLDGIDILTPNQSESAALLDLDRNGLFRQEDYTSIAARLLEKGPSSVILKLGPLGCFWASGKVQLQVPGFKVTALDTTAAGDVFNGALSVALSEGREISEAALFATAASAISVTRRGAQPSIPNRSETEEFLRSHRTDLAASFDR